MKSNLGKLEGIFPIIYCFFNKNNTLDKKLIKDQIKIIKNMGSHGIASLGLATEVNKLSFLEKKNIIELVAEISNKEIRTAVTIQGNSISEYIKLIDIAKNNQADWIILQPLIKKNISNRDCFNFFNKIIPHTKGTMVGIQNAKEYLGVGLNHNDIMKLYNKYENFRSLKAEAPSVFIQKDIETYPKDLTVFNGRGGQEIIDNLLIGCKGIVPATDLADKFLKIFKLIKQKDFRRANLEYNKILPSIVFIMQSLNTLICYGKRVCAYRMGIKNIYDRKPFLEPTKYGIKKAKSIVEELGVY